MKFQTRNSCIRNGITLLSFSFLYAYVIIRAITLSFTHDESLSFTITQGDKYLINTANNHLLNTLLMTISEAAFGNSEFALRLPNVIAFSLFLLGIYLILKPIANNWQYLLGFSALMLNPYELEFFSLSRGYGLSLAFIILSVFFFLRNDTQKTTYFPFASNFVLSVLFASLALFANLAMVNFMIAILVLFAVKYVIFIRKENLSYFHHTGFSLIFIFSLIPLYFAVDRLLLLDGLNQLYYGTSSLFNTFDSLIKFSNFISEKYNYFSVFITYAIFITISIGGFSILYKKDFNSKFFWVFALNIILFFGLIFEHYVFDAKYPSDRTAIMFLPLIALFLVYFITHIRAHYTLLNTVSTTLSIVILIPILINSILGLNLSYTKTWIYDSETKSTMKTIENQIQGNVQKTSLSNNWIFSPSINYYITTRKLNIQPVNNDGVNLSSDFIYIHQQSEILPGYSVIQQNSISSSTLLIKDAFK